MLHSHTLELTRFILMHSIIDTSLWKLVWHTHAIYEMRWRGERLQVYYVSLFLHLINGATFSPSACLPYLFCELLSLSLIVHKLYDVFSLSTFISFNFYTRHCEQRHSSPFIFRSDECTVILCLLLLCLVYCALSFTSVCVGFFSSFERRGEWNFMILISNHSELACLIWCRRKDDEGGGGGCKSAARICM